MRDEVRGTLTMKQSEMNGIEELLPNSSKSGDRLSLFFSRKPITLYATSPA
jgi:hypothetical protein